MNWKGLVVVLALAASPALACQSRRGLRRWPEVSEAIRSDRG